MYSSGTPQPPAQAPREHEMASARQMNGGVEEGQPLTQHGHAGWSPGQARQGRHLPPGNSPWPLQTPFPLLSIAVDPALADLEFIPPL